MPSSTRMTGALLALLVAGSAGCRKQPPPPAAAPAESASAAAKPIDHLAPDELAPSDSEVFGFPIPRGMQLQNRFTDRAYVTGRVAPEALANYVREQVDVSHVEIGAAGTVFPRARIKRGSPDRAYTLEVSRDGPETRLILRDVTPPPPAPPGLSDAERWRAAGLTPEGKPLDMKALE